MLCNAARNKYKYSIIARSCSLAKARRSDVMPTTYQCTVSRRTALHVRRHQHRIQQHRGVPGLAIAVARRAGSSPSSTAAPNHLRRLLRATDRISLTTVGWGWSGQ